MSKASRDKGHNYEREIARRLKNSGIFPDAKRHLEYQFSEAEANRDLDDTQPFAIQCKHWKSTPSITTIEGIGLDAIAGYVIPLAILKRSQKRGQSMLEVAVMRLPAFLTMLQVLRDHELLDEYLERME